MKTSMKSMAYAAILFAGLSLASCKNKDADANDADADTVTTIETETVTVDSLDETGAKDTISETTDTITTVKP